VLSTFIIALREGLEAALIVSILYAYLAKTQRTHLYKALWLGVIAAVALSLGLGALLTFTAHEFSPKSEPAFAGITSVLAVALVTVMVFWMKRAARTISRELHNKVEEAAGIGFFALVVTAFFAVAREGLETALFIYSNFRTARTSLAPSTGLVLGLIAAISLSVLMYKKTVTFNLGKFFQVTGIALIVVAAGVLAHGIGDLQSINWLPGDSILAWNFGGHLSPDSFLASVLSGSIGFSTVMTWLQVGVWASYLATTLFAYLTPSQKVSINATGR